ncbi:MAG: hypothetical protein PHC71_00010 [Candidatus Omnitrophica bacterium]|nr:hypothetical protein [Candidatus Omnitrophota bacterium]
MEIMTPDKYKKSIHPVAIFKEAWGICRNNLGKLGAIYFIFNLPIIIFYLTPVASKLQDQKPNLQVFLGFFIPALIISIWCHISLLLGVKQAVGLEFWTIGQSIKQTKKFFLKYLGTVLIVFLFLMGMIILGGLSAAIILPLLLKVSKILAALICLVLVIVLILFLAYFMILWSLATTVCVLENVRAVTALKKSSSLIKNYVLPVTGTYCLIILVYIACLLPFIIIGTFLGLGNYPDMANRAGTIYSMFINILLVPFWTAIAVILYKKLKEVLEAHVCA